jgi:hypothetical protein
MPVYRLIDDLAHHPSHWLIERAMPRGIQPLRLQFSGTREPALAEADRLNSLIRWDVDEAEAAR